MTNDFNYEFVKCSIKVVCERAGLNIKGFGNENRKRKFLLKSLPDDEVRSNFILYK